MRTASNVAKLFSSVAITSLIALSGCSSGPLSDVTSLSPTIKGDVVDNEQAYADATDQILLTNILRARDRAPLNMGALASISGTLSLSGTAGLTDPFHSLWPPASTSSSGVQPSFTPSITGSTSPTYSFTPLNTQGFTLNAIQPISANYVLNRWDAGLLRKMLMLLFVKEIDFPMNDAKDTNTPTHFVKFINDPDDPHRLKAFTKLVDALLANDANLKAFDVLDPVGPAFDLYSPTNVTVSGSDLTADTDKALKAQPNATSFGFFTGNSDGQYHAGNVLTRDDKNNITSIQGQLYRVYASQVALCIDRQKLGDEYPVPGAAEAVKTAKMTEEQFQILSQATKSRDIGITIKHANPAPLPQLNLSGPMSLMATIAGGPSGGGKTTPGATTPSTGSASSATTAALQAQRVSSIVDEEGCSAAQIVLDPSEEKDFIGKSRGFVHIEWRSLAEVFEYLGAVLRNGEISWTETSPALWVATETQTAKEVYGAKGAAACDTMHICLAPTLFRVSKGIDGGHLGVAYRDGWYSVADAAKPSSDETNPPIDETMTVLLMLSTLVNLANASPSVTTSAPLQLLPVP